MDLREDQFLVYDSKTLDYSKSGITKERLAEQLIAAGYDISPFEIQGPTTADKIIWNGRKWKVVEVDNWQANGFWCCVAVECKS